MSICTIRRRVAAKRQRGFTLIEMMVVVGISTILVLLAAPNLVKTYRRAALKGEGQRLYGAFVQAQGLATANGYVHRLVLDRANSKWAIEVDPDEDNVWKPLMVHPQGSEGWPAYVAFGPENGTADAFPAPYDNTTMWPHDAWCDPCGSSATKGTLTFDIDGRILDTDGNPVNGAVMLHDSTGELSGLVQALVFVGATGDLRLFEMQE